MNSDTNPDVTVFQAISQFANSDRETPDEFADSEPSPSTNSQTSPSTFSKPPFRPIQSQTHSISPSTSSHVSQVTPTYSPFISDELKNFITLKQQLHYPHTLTSHQLSSTTTPPNPPAPTPTSDYIQFLIQDPHQQNHPLVLAVAYRIFKLKFLATPIGY